VDESVDGTPHLRTWDYAVDAFRHIAKVRVASSNLVIRSQERPGQIPFSEGSLVVFEAHRSTNSLYYPGRFAPSSSFAIGGRKHCTTRAPSHSRHGCCSDRTLLSPRCRSTPDNTDTTTNPALDSTAPALPPAVDMVSSRSTIIVRRATFLAALLSTLSRLASSAWNDEPAELMGAVDVASRERATMTSRTSAVPPRPVPVDG
jgi:hypothetical protein